MLKQLQSFFEWKIPVIPFFQRLFKGYARIDIYETAFISIKKILPLIKAFQKRNKNGCPSKLEFDRKEELIALGYKWIEEQYSFDGTKINGQTASERLMDIWNYVIGEMIFAMEYYLWQEDEDCMIPNENYNPNQKESFTFLPDNEENPKYYQFIPNEDYGEKKLDMNLISEKNKRVEKGWEYFGRYFPCLWD